MQFSLPSPQPYVFRCSNILQSSKAGVFQLVSLIVIFTTKFCPYFLFCYMSAIYLVRRSAQCWLWRLSCNFLLLATACFLGTNFHLISLLWILSRYLLRSYGPEYHNTPRKRRYCLPNYTASHPGRNLWWQNVWSVSQTTVIFYASRDKPASRNVVTCHRTACCCARINALYSLFTTNVCPCLSVWWLSEKTRLSSAQSLLAMCVLWFIQILTRSWAINHTSCRDACTPSSCRHLKN